MYLLKMVRMQASMDNVAFELARLQRKWRYPIGFEAVGGFKAVPAMMRKLDPTIEIFGIIPLGDKYTRALPAAAAWQDGRVLIPADEQPWTRDYLDEMKEYTGVGTDVHDDQVDVTGHAWNELYREGPAYDGEVVASGW